MKRFRTLFYFVILVFSLTACEKTPNMSELLVYEAEPHVYALRISDEASFSVKLTTSEEADTFLLTEGETKGVSVAFSATGEPSLCYGDALFPLPETALLRVLHWHELFHLHEKNFLWSIRKEKSGGIEVYRCEAEGVTVYIDAATRLPLKLTSGEVEIDVLSCE